jgi:hypothetical protein
MPPYNNLQGMVDKLPRNFSEVHIDEDCRGVTGFHDNALFFNCKFNNLKGLTLKNCDLNQSSFEVDNIKDALGFTVTLDCFSFNGVKLSPELFDLYLLMLCMTENNDEKREAVKQVIGKEKAERMLKLLRRIE